MALPRIQARKAIDRLFKPLINSQNVTEVANLAFDDETTANKFILSVMRAESKEG